MRVRARASLSFKYGFRYENVRCSTYVSCTLDDDLFNDPWLLMYSVLRSHDTCGVEGAPDECEFPFAYENIGESPSINSSLGSTGGGLFGSGLSAIRYRYQTQRQFLYDSN